MASSKKIGCEFRSLCLVPGSGCLDPDAKKSCIDAQNIRAAKESPCPKEGHGGKCELPQFKAYMVNRGLCESSAECPLLPLRIKGLPARDYQQGINYGSNFGPPSSPAEAVRKLRQAGL